MDHVRSLMLCVWGAFSLLRQELTNERKHLTPVIALNAVVVEPLAFHHQLLTLQPGCGKADTAHRESSHICFL